MSTSRPRSRALRPMTEGLETRQLLSSKTITGQDSDGDRWVLKLEGPGDFRVTKQPDAAGNAQTLASASQIDAINIAGADPNLTRLVGQVRRGANGDGKVFFSTMTEQGGRSEGAAGTNGIYAIDMPSFYLGQTSTASGTAATAPSISIPDGVVTLRFGGADTTFTAPGGTPLATNAAADTFTINLGLPKSQGTSILINTSITSGQASSTTTGTPIQDSVIFNVFGRLNEFQANSIQGNTAFPSSGFRGGGGTLVVSQADTATGVTGQIGFARVGGNATNFAVQTNDKLSDFYVGGETNNVQLLAPAGSRTIGFGKGMDTVTILSHYIDSLQANRGALNSSVTVDRNVGRITFGGDVVNTRFLAGYEQNLTSIFQSQTAPTTAPTAQDGGAIRNVLIAGNVMNSVFAASVEPSPEGIFGTSQDLLLPHGNITAKVGGTIDNSTETPDSPKTAFFSKYVKLERGPVIPPSVPELPYRNQGASPTGQRVVPGLQKSEGQRTNLFPRAGSGTNGAGSGSGSSGTTGSSGTAGTASVKGHTPKGPVKKKD